MSHSPSVARPFDLLGAEVAGLTQQLEARSTESGSVTAAVLPLTLVCDRFLELELRAGGHPLHLLHSTAATLHAFAAAISKCEQAGLGRETLLPYLEKIRTLHAQSPLVDRLQRWPRGYPGDFETVEWLCDARNHAPFPSVGWAIEQCALQSPIAQQHRNKVEVQARTILTTLAENAAARIMSIGCGGCRDMALVQKAIPENAGTFVLVDADADALQFAKARLDRLADRIQCVHGRVPRVLSKFRGEEPFDLIVAGGLFDYLADPWAIATLSAARRLLAPGGRMFFSNIAANNPFRQWIEYLGDWHLIERTEADLRRLLATSGFDVERTAIARETTGLALLVDAVNAAGAAT